MIGKGFLLEIQKNLKTMLFNTKHDFIKNLKHRNYEYN